MTDVTYPLFPIFAFVGLILSLIPLPWHLQAWNSGTCYFMMWSALACLNQFINSIVWSDNTANRAPIWCEISIRILLGASIGLPAASLCINRRLYQIASTRDLRMGPAEKIRAILIDTLICVLFPVVFVALQYIVQGHRFDIIQGVGCYPAIYNTLLTYFLNTMWPIIIGLISVSYCIRTLCAFARRRLEFSQIISRNNSSLTMSRYFRLMALAMCDIFFTTPLAIFSMWLNLTLSPLRPWISWANTHYDYGRVVQIPAIIWRSNHTLATCIELTRWLAPMCAIVFFLFFGLADEAKKNYRLAFRWVMQRVRCVFPFLPVKREKIPGGHKMLSSTGSESATLPMYSPPPCSAYPAFDTKRSGSFAAQGDNLLYSVAEKAVESETTAHDPSHDSNMYTSPTLHSGTGGNRFSWKSLSVPFADRRHSSYF